MNFTDVYKGLFGASYVPEFGIKINPELDYDEVPLLIVELQESLEAEVALKMTSAQKKLRSVATIRDDLVPRLSGRAIAVMDHVIETVRSRRELIREVDKFVDAYEERPDTAYVGFYTKLKISSDERERAFDAEKRRKLWEPNTVKDDGGF